MDIMNEPIIGSITGGQLIAWIILGLLVGSFVGRIIRTRRRGFGIIGNLIIGLVGAVIGGILFDVLRVEFGREVVLSLNDFVAAFCGALIFIAVVTLIRR
jgi:uncharacterized membrane protein YeaQ/YmgE (transglycosylase-associated protein family)